MKLYDLPSDGLEAWRGNWTLHFPLQMSSIIVLLTETIAAGRPPGPNDYYRIATSIVIS